MFQIDNVHFPFYTQPHLSLSTTLCAPPVSIMRSREGKAVVDYLFNLSERQCDVISIPCFSGQIPTKRTVLASPYLRRDKPSGTVQTDDVTIPCVCDAVSTVQSSTTVTTPEGITRKCSLTQRSVFFHCRLPTLH